MSIAERDTPVSRSQAVSVANTSMKGSPAEKPRNSIRSAEGRVYTSQARRQRDCGAAFISVMPPSWLGRVVIDDQGRVVGKIVLGVNFRLARQRSKAGRGHLVINPPAHVVGARVAPLGPCATAVRTGIDLPERIDQWHRHDDLVQPGPLLAQ